jgi:ADP-ribosylglycohydrolase
VAADILDAVYGCLIGGAIGDALGAPVEGWYYTDIREKYGRITELEPGKRGNTGLSYGRKDVTTPPGTITDDSALRYYMCLAIAKKGARITPDDFADVWRERLNPDRVWVNERIVKQKLQIGMNPWDTGKATIPTGCATMAISPIGIINAGNPAQAYQDGFNIAFVNQDGEDRDAAATAAAAVATAFLPGATVEQVIEAMFTYSSAIVRRALELTLDLAHESSDIDAFAEKFYAKMLDWKWPQPGWNKTRYFSGSSLEILPVTAAILHFCQGDVNQSIIEGASFGRDCDTIASLAGSIAGAMQGAGVIRRDWIDTVEQANRDLFEEAGGDPYENFLAMAKRLVEALEKEKQAAQARHETLTRILTRS